MDLTNQQAPSMAEAMKRFEAGEITETDIIQMLNTTQQELERSLQLVRVLSGAVMLRLQTKAKPAEAMAPAPTKTVSDQTPVAEVKTTKMPTPVAPQETAEAVLLKEGQAINYHSIVLTFAAPHSIPNGRGDLEMPTYNERLDPASPDFVAMLNEWPCGVYAGGEQTFLRMGNVGLIWQHPQNAPALNDRPTYVFSLPDGAGVELAKVTSPDTMRAVILDIVAAAQQTLMRA